MTITRPTFRLPQLLLAFVLFLVSQLALALHTHDLSSHSLDAEDCVICLVTSSDNPAPVSETPHFYFPAENSPYLPSHEVLAAQPRHTPSQARAPPLS